MTEYIEREAALQIIDYAKQLTSEQIVRESGTYKLLPDTGKACYDGIIAALDMCKHLIKEAVIATDVQPAKRGHWYDVGYEYIDELGINLIHAYCNRCNRITYNRSDYSHTMDCERCSHCGAIMDNWGLNKI